MSEQNLSARSVSSDTAGRSGMPPPAAAQAERPTLTVVNPADGQPGQSYDGHSLADAHAIVASARQAFESWRQTSFAERAELMRSVAAVLLQRRNDFADLMTEEMGKRRADGYAEIDKCISASEHYAAYAEHYLEREPVDVGGPKAFVTFVPLGTILSVMPWNFPFWQVLRSAIPALMAGNTGVLKHASSVPGCALALEDLFREAGFPDDVFRTLLIPSDAVRPIIEDPNIAAVTLTGSVAAGRSVASAAGGVLKKCVLELGGSDAYVVLKDADIEEAATICATARMVNGGQSCNAGKRFIVVRAVREAFETAFVERMRSYVMGDPRDEQTLLGPMQSVRARDEIHSQVEASIAGGARLLLGGVVPERPGAWYPATVLTDVRPGQPAHDEEVFGPVGAVIEAADEAEAIEIANASSFGLGSAVLTCDLERGERIAADELDAGNSFVNGNVRSDPRMPFGGVKNSGYGRECSGYGIREFVNIKSVKINCGCVSSPA